MKMHKVFTHIPLQSYKAFVGRREPTLDAVMAALAVDPLRADEAFDQLGVEGVPRSLVDFTSRGAVAGSRALDTIAQWTLTREDARAALVSLVRYNRALGVWAACGLARQVLRNVPMGVKRPLLAIETAERWVRGEATTDDCRKAAIAAMAAADQASRDEVGPAANDAANAAYAAAYAALSAVYAFDEAASATYAGAAADAAAGALATAQWNASRRSELQRLRKVVADACLSYPAMQ